MDRVLILCLTGVLAGCLTSSEPRLPTDSRPNVVLILTDDQGVGDLGITGNPVLETPNIDRLARESVSLSTFYVSPVCTPP